jgi:hypothetical protein
MLSLRAMLHLVALLTGFLGAGCSSNSSSGGSPNGVDGFFEQIKGEYEYFAAQDSAGNDNLWTHGEKYTITVDASDKSVTFANKGEAIKFTFESDERDIFESADHEETAIMHKDDAKALVQRQDNKVYFTYGNTGNWQFSDEQPDPLPAPFEAYGIDYVVGPDFDEQITWVQGSAPQWNIGDAIAVEVDNGTGAVTTTPFGDFTWDSHKVSEFETGGKKVHSITWCKPDCENDTLPREQFSIELYAADGTPRRISYGKYDSAENHFYRFYDGD